MLWGFVLWRLIKIIANSYVYMWIYHNENKNDHLRLYNLPKNRNKRYVTYYNWDKNKVWWYTCTRRSFHLTSSPRENMQDDDNAKVPQLVKKLFQSSTTISTNYRCVGIWALFSCLSFYKFTHCTWFVKHECLMYLISDDSIDEV